MLFAAWRNILTGRRRGQEQLAAAAKASEPARLIASVRPINVRPVREVRMQWLTKLLRRGSGFDHARFGTIDSDVKSMDEAICILQRMDDNVVVGIIRKSTILAAAANAGVAQPTQDQLDMYAVMSALMFVGLTREQVKERTAAGGSIVQWVSSIRKVFKNVPTSADGNSWDVPCATVGLRREW